MARGRKSAIGSRTTNANGYTYEKTENGWVPAHHLIAKEKLGRPLNQDERVAFKDGDHRNISTDNIIVVKKRSMGLEAQIARIEAQIESLQDKLSFLKSQRSS